MSDQSSSSSQNWQPPEGEPYESRQHWFTPENALTEEQIAALQSDDLDPVFKVSLDSKELPTAAPKIKGSWYTPQSAYSIEPARTLGDVLPIDSLPEPDFLDMDISAEAAPIEEALAEEILPEPALDIEAASVEETVEPLEAPIVEIDAEEEAFREMPHIDGDVSSEIHAAPELPLSAQLNPGLGGLRDETREPEPNVEADAEGIRFEEISANRETPAAIEVPERGLGGVADRPVTSEQPAVSVNNEPQIEVPARGFGGVRDEQRPPTQEVAPVSNSLANNQQQIASNDAMSSESAVVKRFREVEQSVAALRQQFAQGQITRNQLENELKRLMVLDDQGRWWTLGVDSKRWYRYDGREWVPDTPPQTSSQPAVQAPSAAASMNVPTETGVQPPVGATGATQPDTGSSTPQMAIDDNGMPLPQRVAVDDPGATAVNLNAITSGVGADEVTIEKPGPSPENDPVSSAQSAIAPAQADAAAQAQQSGSGYGDADSANYRSQEKPKQKSLQPDYSEALGASFSRSSIVRVGVWTGVAGMAASLGLVLCLLLAVVAYYFSVVNDYSTAIEELPDRASRFQTTYIYGPDESLELARFNDPNRGARTRVSLDEISPWAIHALVSTEDETYYENPGFSMYAIARSTYTNLTGSGVQSGASTITQQLTRRLLLDEEFASQISAERKITEIFLAAEISRIYTKNEILELYFNEMSFGGSTVGIEAAAQVYFGKSAAELNVFEAALLVGLVQSPAQYDPFYNREAALGRMTEVLRLMTEANGDGCVQMQHTTIANDVDYQAVTGQPYVFDLSQPLCVTEEYLLNEVPLLRAYVEGEPFDFFGLDRQYDHFTLWVWDEVNRMYDDETIFNSGFRIYTTINPAIQDVAQQAINDRLAYASGRGYRVNNGSAVVLDPRNGAVLAMVGSADFSNDAIDGEVNVALRPRQPGSSIKPVVYLAAMEGFPETGDYWTASTVIWDVPSTWGTGAAAYTPENFDRQFRGPVTLRYALANSLNIPAVKGLAYTTPGQFEIVANRMGITFPLQPPQSLAAALGAVEVRLIDMVAAYSAFANGGFRYEPYGISRIVDAEGNVVYDAFAIGTSPQQTIDPQHAYIISDILSDQNTRSDTFGQALVVPGYGNVAAKTGTSNDARDMWTIGWTPTVITAIWMGNTDNSATGAISGSEVVGPAWRSVMSQALSSNGQDPNLDFTPPDGLVRATVCRDSGAQVPAEGCGAGGTTSDIYINAGILEAWPNGQLPPDSTEHFVVSVGVDSFTNLIANEFCPNNAVQRNFLNIDDVTALNWLQNTTQGRNWATSRGIDPDTISGDLPTEACDASYVEPVAVLTSPPNAATVSQQVTFTGSVAAPGFQRYDIEFASMALPDVWSVLPGQSFEFQHPSPNETLGFWNSTTIADGQYRIRVVVYATNGASISSDPIVVTVANNVSTGTVDPISPATDTSSDIPSLDNNSDGEAIPAGESQ